MKVNLTYEEFKASTLAQNVNVYYLYDPNAASAGGIFTARAIVKGVTLEHQATAQPSTWALDFPLSKQVDSMAPD